MQARTFLLTLLAMIAFAGNSVLGRLGLVDGGIGAGSFVLIRLLSGAVVLVLIAGPRRSLSAGSWSGGLCLFIYAAFFSYAYLALPAGTGALILFALVQITMVGAGLLAGERLSVLQWSGMATAVVSLIWLLSPSIEAPPLWAAGLMAIAGISWGLYSLIGRHPSDKGPGERSSPTRRTAGNFLRASLLAVLVLPIILFQYSEPSPHPYGILLAISSGAITSGLGYVIWYAALPSLSATRAGIAQLCVPAIAALGGILILSEQLSPRFLLASGLILAGVGMATLTKNRQNSD